MFYSLYELYRVLFSSIHLIKFQKSNPKPQRLEYAFFTEINLECFMFRFHLSLVFQKHIFH